MKMEFQIKTDNTQQIIAEKNEAVLRALEIIGQVVENSAAGYAPVDTGNLRNSISHADDGTYAYIGTNVEYAPYVELGTVRMPERPFLRNAVLGHQEEYRNIMEEGLKN
jgi:HK97 gp10 family phage protein